MKKLLQQLTETFGPSGYEDNVRKLVRAEVKSLADEIKVDALGNLIVRKKPAKQTKDTKKIMIAAHMDEIGVMVTHVDNNGFVRFTGIGGVYPRNLKIWRGCMLAIPKERPRVQPPKVCCALFKRFT